MAEVGRRAIFSDAAGTDLCLHPPGCCPKGVNCSTAEAILLTTITAATAPSPPQEQETTRRPLTIVYGDRAFTVNVSEAQAWDILRTTRRGAERSAQAGGSGREDPKSSGVVPATSVPGAAESAYPSGSALAQSMKGSLRRFLEKRAARVRDVSGLPYTKAAKLHSSPSLCHGP